MADWSNQALAVDIAYCNIIDDYEQFVQNGVGIALIKLSQGAEIYDKLFDTHWHKCKQAGMLRGAYHIFDPRARPLEQLNWINRYYPAVEADLPIAIDCEDLPGLDLSTYSNAALIQQIGNLWGLLAQEYGKKPIIYTGGWWWNAHMTPAPAWIQEADFWVTDYTHFEEGRVDVTWADFKTQWLPVVENFGEPVTGGPAVTWTQISGDKFCFPGVRGPVDIDLFNGSLEDCVNHYGIHPGLIGENPMDYPCYSTFATPYLNIRSGPGKAFADIGDLYPNIPVIGYEEQDDWVKIDPIREKWVYKPYLKKHE